LKPTNEFLLNKHDFMKKTTTALLLGIILFSACMKKDLSKKDLNDNEPLNGPPPTTCSYPSVNISTHAGAGYAGYIDGNVLLAQFKDPQSITSFGSSLFVGDRRYIRQITGTTVSTFVTLPDGEHITSLATDLSGNIYAAVGMYHDASLIKKFSPTGTLLATWGSFKQLTYRDGDQDQARFTIISGIAVDETGLVYIADLGSYAIRLINLDGTVSTLAGGLGTGRPGHGFEDGPVATAKLGMVQGVAVTPSGDKVYVADDHAVRMITGGYVYTIAGGASKGFIDGAGPSARFFQLSGIAIDGAGSVYVTDNAYVSGVEPASYVRKVIKMTSGLVAWKVTTLAGNSYGYANGPGADAKFYRAAELVIDNGATTAYIADANNYRIRKMSLSCGITF